MTIVYSRDVMAWPLRHLGKVMALVKRGFFDPDATRSGRWAGQDDEFACDAFGKAVKDVGNDVVADDPNRRLCSLTAVLKNPG